MMHNGYKEFVQSPPLTSCRGCGEPVDLTKEDTSTGAVTPQCSQEEDGTLWHQDCFNSYLDQGEEI